MSPEALIDTSYWEALPLCGTPVTLIACTDSQHSFLEIMGYQLRRSRSDGSWLVCDSAPSTPLLLEAQNILHEKLTAISTIAASHETHHSFDPVRLFPDHYPVKLLHHTHIDHLRPSRPLTAVELLTPVSALLTFFYRERVTSAAVIDPKTRRYSGFVDLGDVISAVASLTTGPGALPFDAAYSAVVTLTAGALLEQTVSLPSVSNKLSLPGGTSVASLFERMTRLHVHYVAVTTRDEDDDDFDRLEAVVTETEIVAWITQHVKAFEQPSLAFDARKTLARLGLGDARDHPVTTAPYTSTVIQAVQQLRQSHDSVLAVVDANGNLLGDFSLETLLGVSDPTTLLAALQKPVAPHAPVAIVKATDTLEDVLMRLVESKSHHAFVIGTKGEPSSLVTVQDVVRLFSMTNS